MKKKILLFAGLMLAAGVQAQTSPWAGNVLPEEGGTFYLYQVETGLWLQNNNKVAEDWTTRAQIDKYGFDVEIIKLPDGGYQLNPKFGHNHSINDFNYYLDTEQPLTKWNIEPTTVNGVTNTYKIYSDDDHYLNASDEGILDDFGFNENWQLVTYEQRLEDMKTATPDSPKDATWLLGGHDFANQDERNKWDVVQEGDGVYAQGGDGIVHGNRAVECWKKTKFQLSRTFTGLPNGTYEFKLQGFYRDGSEVNIAEKRASGEEQIRAFLFLNDVSRPFKSILDSGVTEPDNDSYACVADGYCFPGDKLTPGNALDRASNCFFKGGYWSEPVKVVVSDGNLTVGMQKIGGGDDDWMVFDSFTLTYLGSEIDLGPVKENLQSALNDAAAYEGVTVAVLTNALAAAQALINGTDAVAIANGTMALRNALAAAQDYTNVKAEAEAFDGVKPDFFNVAVANFLAAVDETDLEAFNEAVKNMRNALNDVRGVQEPLQFIAATIPFAQEAGVDAAIIQKAQALMEHCDSAFRIHDVLNELRVARMIQAADKHADVFAGQTPAEGDYYIYNVGMKRFLCGGGDWGAHAYVGFPGVKVSLVSGFETPEEGEPYSGYAIDTHLNNGGESEYLNYGGYMDTPDQNLWEFVPVAGKDGVYAIARANGEANADTGERMLLGWRPGTYGNIDTDMYGVNDVNNQWKLVTEEERNALLATATKEAPQDATYMIVSPNFNQREDVSAWVSVYGNGSIWGRGGRYDDFAFECWNEIEFELDQMLFDMLPGWYALTVQGYYRDGDHWDQIRAEASGEKREQAAALIDLNDDQEVALPNILSEVNNAPGQGDRRTTRYQIQKTDEFGEPVYNDETGEPVMVDDPESEELYVGEFPYDIPQACNYFRNGLYKTTMLVEVKADGYLTIAVSKQREKARDWVVVDNFRLTYYGAEKPEEDEQGVQTVEVPVSTTAKIYNLQGQQVKNVTKGLFIRDGKKFVKK
jgi:hypothetical protein